MRMRQKTQRLEIPDKPISIGTLESVEAACRKFLVGRGRMFRWTRYGVKQVKKALRLRVRVGDRVLRPCSSDHSSPEYPDRLESFPGNWPCSSWRPTSGIPNTSAGSCRISHQTKVPLSVDRHSNEVPKLKMFVKPWEHHAVRIISFIGQ